MSDILITPSIEVTIGRQTRIYHAFVTTAPSALRAVDGDALCWSTEGRRRPRCR
jgi:hypothetical protein